RRSHAGKVDVVAAPLFPRYLFVAIDLESQRWRSIWSTFGVAQLVCRGGRPAPLAAEIIAELRSREDEGGLIRLGRSFRPGERVRVVGGVFADQLAMFDSMGDGERVAVLLDLLGRKVRAVVNINHGKIVRALVAGCLIPAGRERLRVKLQGKRVLVTGADGFIGSHLTEHLVRLGADVRAFVFYNSFNSWGWLDEAEPLIQKSIDVVAGDVRDPHGVRAAMAGCDVVMHLAALIGIPYSYHSPDAYVDTN
ncbi:hypothetical protein KXV85_000503, partial [Aspergillus fumigatus]